MPGFCRMTGDEEASRHVATAIERERQKAENAVVLHAGDLVQGSPVSTIFRGTPAFEVANALGIDAHCLGNHEFDYGWERIKDFERASDAPILAANVLNSQGDLLLRPATVLQAGDLEIAVIGALTPQVARIDQARPSRAVAFRCPCRVATPGRRRDARARGYGGGPRPPI